MKNKDNVSYYKLVTSSSLKLEQPKEDGEFAKNKKTPNPKLSITKAKPPKP